MDVTRELRRFGHQEVSGKTAYRLGNGGWTLLSFYEYDGCVLQEPVRFPTLQPPTPKVPEGKKIEHKYRKE